MSNLDFEYNNSYRTTILLSATCCALNWLSFPTSQIVNKLGDSVSLKWKQSQFFADILVLSELLFPNLVLIVQSKSNFTPQGLIQECT